MGVTGTVKYIFHLPTRTKHLARSPSSSSTPRKEKAPEYVKSHSIQVTLSGPDNGDHPRTRHGAVSFQELQPPPHSRHYRQTSCNPSSSGTSGRGSSRSKGKVAMTTAAKKGRPAAVRVVSWASIVGDRPRWTEEQERELEFAEVELRRCQKAWSSEQEVWLARVCSSPFLTPYSFLLYPLVPFLPFFCFLFFFSRSITGRLHWKCLICENRLKPSTKKKKHTRNSSTVARDNKTTSNNFSARYGVNASHAMTSCNDSRRSGFAGCDARRTETTRKKTPWRWRNGVGRVD